MPQTQIVNNEPLKGVVIETFEEKGKPLAKIALRPMLIEVPLEQIQGAHLGDVVKLDVTLTIHAIEAVNRLDSEEFHDNPFY